MTDHASTYAFPHAGANERRRLELLEARLDDPDFLGCGFAFIGAWGRRPPGG